MIQIHSIQSIHPVTCYLLVLLSLICAQSMFAQDNRDCATALTLCGESPYHIIFTEGVGTPDPGVDLTCLTIEFNATWITWSIQQGGTLTFVLTPDSIGQDLDFGVYQMMSANDCKNKELVRCMASGENAGAPPPTWEICTGATGLSFGETDLEELAGCSAGDNNFLAPLETQAGEQYVLLVNNFGVEGAGYLLSFGGTAVLDCSTVATSDLHTYSALKFEIHPTISSGSITITSVRETLPGKVIVYDMNGQIMHIEDTGRHFPYCN